MTVLAIVMAAIVMVVVTMRPDDADARERPARHRQTLSTIKPPPSEPIGSTLAEATDTWRDVDLACRPGTCPVLTLSLVELAAYLRLYCNDAGQCAGDLLAWEQERWVRVA